MTDSKAVFGELGRVLDTNGDPVANAKINFYETTLAGAARAVYSDSGLTTSLGSIVYTDSGGYPVSEEAGSTKVTVYTGTSAYAFKVTDSTGSTTYVTKENVPGALDTSTYGQSSTSWNSPVVAKSSNFTVTTSDKNKLFDVDCSSAVRTATLPSAVDFGDGDRVGFRHNGSANSVVIDAVSSQNIEWGGTATASIVLTNPGEAVWIVSNGVDWRVANHLEGLLSSDVPIIKIADRLSTPPGSPTEGSKYILTSSPTGDWASFAEHDIVRWDGTTWRRFDKTLYADGGMLAFVQDENATYQYQDTAWVSLSATQADMEAATKTGVFSSPANQHQHPAHAKVFASVNSSGTLLRGWGCTTSRDGTGNYSITFDTPMSDNAYAVVATVAGTSNIRIARCSVRNTTDCTIVTSSTTSSVDESFSVAIFGDQ